MTGGDLQRAEYIRRVFDRCLARVDPELPARQRVDRAMELMDRKLGPGWRGELSRAGVDFLEMEIFGRPPVDSEGFWKRLKRSGPALGVEVTIPQRGDDQLKNKILAHLDKLLSKVL